MTILKFILKIEGCIFIQILLFDIISFQHLQYYTLEKSFSIPEKWRFPLIAIETWVIFVVRLLIN